MLTNSIISVVVVEIFESMNLVGAGVVVVVGIVVVDNNGGG